MAGHNQILSAIVSPESLGETLIKSAFPPGNIEQLAGKLKDTADYFPNLKKYPQSPIKF